MSTATVNRGPTFSGSMLNLFYALKTEKERLGKNGFVQKFLYLHGWSELTHEFIKRPEMGVEVVRTRRNGLHTTLCPWSDYNSWKDKHIECECQKAIRNPKKYIKFLTEEGPREPKEFEPEEPEVWEPEPRQQEVLPIDSLEENNSEPQPMKE